MYIIVVKRPEGFVSIYAKNKTAALKAFDKLNEQGLAGSWQGHDGDGWEDGSVNANNVIPGIPANPIKVFTIL